MIMKEYKNIIGKILMILGTFISSICVSYEAFSSNFMLGIIVLSIIMIFFGLLLCMNEK